MRGLDNSGPLEDMFSLSPQICPESSSGEIQN